MSWTDFISIEDERFHPSDGDPWWNESSFITFRVPERQLLGIIYFYFRPNQNTAMGGPILVDPTGDEISTCLHLGWGWHMPIPDDANMFDFTLANGLSVRTIEPQRRYLLNYEAAGCSFSLEYTTDGLPQAMPTSDKKQAGEGISDYVGKAREGLTTGHFDQTGVIAGTLTIGEEKVAVSDSSVFQDRSWGPRIVLQSQVKKRGALVFARASQTSLFHAWIASETPWDQDDVDGALDRIASGYLVRDGIGMPLVGGTRQVLERGHDGRPIREIIEAVDASGRKLYAEGRIKATLKWAGLYGDVASFWCYEEWEFDGHRAAPGELQEWMMCRHYRQWLQQR